MVWKSIQLRLLSIGFCDTYLDSRIGGKQRWGKVGMLLGTTITEDEGKKGLRRRPEELQIRRYE